MPATLAIEFRLIGQGFTPSQINVELGIACTKYETSDDGSTGFWVLSRTFEGEVDVGGSLVSFVSELLPRQRKLMDIYSRYALKCDLCIEVHDEPRAAFGMVHYPARNFCVGPEVMRFLAALEATLYIEGGRLLDR